MAYPGQNVLLTIIGEGAQDVFNLKVYDVINSVETDSGIELSIGNGITETDPVEEGAPVMAVSYVYTIPITAVAGDTYKAILKPSGTSVDIAEAGKVEFDYGILTEVISIVQSSQMSISLSLSF